MFTDAKIGQEKLPYKKTTASYIIPTGFCTNPADSGTITASFVLEVGLAMYAATHFL